MNPELLNGFLLGGYRIDPVKGEVDGPAGRAHLPPRAMEVLLCLASNPGELVPRRKLVEEVWGRKGASPETVGRAIHEVRHALGDQADSPRFIQTLPGRGYRLLVQPATDADESPAAAAGPEDGFGSVGLFENLRQRGVIEAGVAYLVFGWLIIQVADIVFDQLHLPAWSGTFVTVLVIAGFPIALLLSWFLEFRDGRAVVDTRSPRELRNRQFSRTYLSVVVAMLIAAAGVWVYEARVGLPRPEATTAEEALQPRLPPIRDNSIAVLPFLNLDGSEQTQIFANGLVDDVITRLSRVPSLLVSSRGDAFSLEPNSASQRVRERLRVAAYLEGSVQISGPRMRIIVQMIDSETGFHILSRSFDRALEDFFAIRDEITRLTVANVRVALPPETRQAAEGLSDDPSLDVYVLYRRGVEAALLENTEKNLRKALDWYQAALELDPDYAAAHAGICWAYVDLYPETDDSAYIGQAETACARALQLNPNLDIVHAALGELYLATGRHDQAEASLLTAHQLDPRSVAALTGLGEVYRLQRRLGEAEERYRQAIGLHPGDWSAYNSLGYFLYRSGRYAEAAEQFEVVIALDPGNRTGWTNLGAAYFLSGNFEAALDTYQRSRDAEASDTSYSNLGMIYYYLGRYREAIDALSQAVGLAPRDHLGWSGLGDALWIAGDEQAAAEAYATAEQHLKGALAVNPNDAQLQMDHAWITAMLGRLPDARRRIDQVLRLTPDDPYVHYYSGLIRMRANDVEGALADFEQALERGYPVALLAQDPQLERLRGNPRFRRMSEPGETD